jgi:SAM-dependent methyltransferase
MKNNTEKYYAPIADPIILELIRSHFPEVRRQQDSHAIHVTADTVSGERICTVLDLGCGSGGNAAYLKAAGFDVTGITINAEEAQATSSICPVLVFDLTKGLPSEIKRKSFNIVLAAHLLEHIFYPEVLLKNIMDVCRDGLLIVIPNLLYWRNRMKMLFGIFEYADLGIMDYTHSRWYTLKTIQELLEKYGFVIASKTATGGVFPESFPLHRLLNKLLCKLFPGLFGFQFYIVATKSKV